MRGCSFITDFEYLNLSLLISFANKNKPLYTEHYTYDYQQQKIVTSDKSHCYVGNTQIGLKIKKKTSSSNKFTRNSFASVHYSKPR